MGIRMKPGEDTVVVINYFCCADKLLHIFFFPSRLRLKKMLRKMPSGSNFCPVVDFNLHCDGLTGLMGGPKLNLSIPTERLVPTKCRAPSARPSHMRDLALPSASQTPTSLCNILHFSVFSEAAPVLDIFSSHFLRRHQSCWAMKQCPAQRPRL